MDLPDLGWIQWGDAPSWVAAPSLLVALAVFNNDRRDRVRAQIGRVAVWGEMTGGHTQGPQNQNTKVVTIDARSVIRNQTDLPIRVIASTWRYTTTWGVPDEPKVAGVVAAYERTPGTEVGFFFTHDPIFVAPMASWEQVSTLHVGHVAPHPRARLWQIQPLVLEAVVLLVRDNAGREWLLTPDAGGQAKRNRNWAPWRCKDLPPGFAPRPWRDRAKRRWAQLRIVERSS